MTNGGGGGGTGQGGDELELGRGFVRGRQDRTRQGPTAGPTAKMKQKGKERGKGRGACGENAFTYMYSRRMSSRLQKQRNVTVGCGMWDGGACRQKSDKVWRGRGAKCLGKIKFSALVK